MHNVIEACIHHQSKLVFFDNVYRYGRVDGWMAEETPVNPVSKKGEVRARIAEMLMDEVKKGTIGFRSFNFSFLICLIVLLLPLFW